MYARTRRVRRREGLSEDMQNYEIIMIADDNCMIKPFFTKIKKYRDQKLKR